MDHAVLHGKPFGIPLVTPLVFHISAKLFPACLQVAHKVVDTVELIQSCSITSSLCTSTTRKKLLGTTLWQLDEVTALLQVVIKHIDNPKEDCLLNCLCTKAGKNIANTSTLFGCRLHM